MSYSLNVREVFLLDLTAITYHRIVSFPETALPRNRWDSKGCQNSLFVLKSKGPQTASFRAGQTQHFHFNMVLFALVRTSQVKIPSKGAPISSKVCPVKVPSLEEKLCSIGMKTYKAMLWGMGTFGISRSPEECMWAASKAPQNDHKTHISVRAHGLIVLSEPTSLPTSPDLLIREEVEHNMQNKGRIMNTWRKLILEMPSGTSKN